jgi:hypothetical protein
MENFKDSLEEGKQNFIAARKLKMSIHLGSFGASKFEPGCGLKNTRN